MIIVFFVKAQGNLQFNRVVNFSNGSNYTVPNNKVIKIESINQNNAVISSAYNGNCTIMCPSCGTSSGVTCYYNGLEYLKIGSISYAVGGGSLYIGSGGNCNVCPATKNDATTLPLLNCPIWIGAGETIKISLSGVVISCLEFNLIQ